MMKQTHTVPKLSKEEFDELYVDPRIPIHCPTEELANELLTEAYLHGYTWGSSTKYTAHNNYEAYMENTIYIISGGTYGNKIHYEVAEEFKGFQAKEVVNPLFDTFNKSDMTFKMIARNGDVFGVGFGSNKIRQFDSISDTYVDWGCVGENLTEDLRCRLHENFFNEFDIMQVYIGDILLFDREHSESKKVESDKQKRIQELEAELAQLKKEL